MLGEPARPAVENVLAELADHGLLVEGPPRRGRRAAAGSRDRGAARRRCAPGAGRSPTLSPRSRSCSVGVVGDGCAGLEVARLLRARAASGSSGSAGRKASTSPSALRRRRAPAPPGVERGRRSRRAAVAPGPALRRAVRGRRPALPSRATPCCHECFRLGGVAQPRCGRRAFAARCGSRCLPVDAGGRCSARRRSPSQLALGWLVLGDHYAPAAFYALELVPTITLTSHHVHRVPRCDACSGLADVAAAAALVQGGAGCRRL